MPAIENHKRAGGPAWLRYRLDMAGVVGSNPTRPKFASIATIPVLFEVRGV